MSSPSIFSLVWRPSLTLSGGRVLLTWFPSFSGITVLHALSCVTLLSFSLGDGVHSSRFQVSSLLQISLIPNMLRKRLLLTWMASSPLMWDVVFLFVSSLHRTFAESQATSASLFGAVQQLPRVVVFVSPCALFVFFFFEATKRHQL